MSVEVVAASPSWVIRLRDIMAVVGVVLFLAFAMPPLSSKALRYEFGEAIQFAVLAFVVPALVVGSAEWRRLRLSSTDAHVVSDDGTTISPRSPLVVDRIAIKRATVFHQRRAIFTALAFAVLVVFWRVAPVVDYLVRHPWLVPIEGLSLLALGVALFTRLIESPPLKPGTLRPYRIGISAAVMWVTWVVAYLDGMSHSSWYNVFRHVAGSGISKAADQQLSAGLMWLLSAAVFLPIIFWNLIHWLQSEEDPNEELQRMVRDERTRGFFGVD